MKWTIKYIESGNYFEIINEGVYEEGDSARVYQNLFLDKNWKPGSSILMDYRLVDFRNINYQVLSKTSQLLVGYEAQIGSCKIGYLAELPVGYGRCRQFQMLVEGKIPPVLKCLITKRKLLNGSPKSKT
jgi:hypothetical protein